MSTIIYDGDFIFVTKLGLSCNDYDIKDVCKHILDCMLLAGKRVVDVSISDVEMDSEGYLGLKYLCSLQFTYDEFVKFTK